MALGSKGWSLRRLAGSQRGVLPRGRGSPGGPVLHEAALPHGGNGIVHVDAERSSDPAGQCDHEHPFRQSAVISSFEGFEQPPLDS
jgi:hypothetical protein